MDLIEFATTRLGWLPPGLLAWLERRLTRLPAVRAAIEKEYDGLLGGLEEVAKPYRGDFAAYAQLPAVGRPRDEVLREMEALKRREEARWKDGFVSGGVYHGDDEHVAFLNQAYALHSQTNPLHSDVWPSTAKFEAEIVAMTAHMLGAARAGEGAAGGVCGTVTSGGTESILLAMKTYRDWARETKGIRQPAMVVPSTAHAAFDKAAHYFGMKLVRVP